MVTCQTDRRVGQHAAREVLGERRDRDGLREQMYGPALSVRVTTSNSGRRNSWIWNASDASPPTPAVVDRHVELRRTQRRARRHVDLQVESADARSARRRRGRARSRTRRARDQCAVRAAASGVTAESDEVRTRRNQPLTCDRFAGAVDPAVVERETGHRIAHRRRIPFVLRVGGQQRDVVALGRGEVAGADETDPCEAVRVGDARRCRCRRAAPARRRAARRRAGSSPT